MTTLRLPMVAMLSLALAACGTSREIRVLDDDAAAEAPAVEAKKERRDVAAAPPRPMPTAADIAAAPNPLTLKGAAVDAVEATLGPATLLRREPPAEVWQYRGRTCVLDVVLYPDETDDASLTVAHVELRPVDETATVFPKACAADVLQTRVARG